MSCTRSHFARRADVAASHNGANDELLRHNPAQVAHLPARGRTRGTWRAARRCSPGRVWAKSQMEQRAAEGTSCEIRSFLEVCRKFYTSVSLHHQVSPDVALLRIRLPFHKYTYTHTDTYTLHTHRYTCTNIHVHICKWIYIYIYTNRCIMNHQRHNNIWNGIVWARTSHSTSTCTVTLHVTETRTHHKFESFKKNPRRRKSNSNLIINSKDHRNRSKLFRWE